MCYLRDTAVGKDMRIHAVCWTAAEASKYSALHVDRSKTDYLLMETFPAVCTIPVLDLRPELLAKFDSL